MKVKYLVCSTHLILSENFDACAESHQGLIDVAWRETIFKNCISYEMKGFEFFQLRQLTCFPKTVALCTSSACAFTASQIHQTQLTHIHLVFILEENLSKADLKVRRGHIFLEPLLQPVVQIYRNVYLKDIVSICIQWGLSQFNDKDTV